MYVETQVMKASNDVSTTFSIHEKKGLIVMTRELHFLLTGWVIFIYLFIMLFLHSKGLSFALVAYAFNYYNRIDYVIILLIKISTL